MATPNERHRNDLAEFLRDLAQDIEQNNPGWQDALTAAFGTLRAYHRLPASPTSREQAAYEQEVKRLTTKV